jgi:uncharacterized OB-fold protein
MENSEHLLALGITRLDGADTGLVHRIGDVDLKTINFGMRVKVVFSEERRGDIRDIKYFKPI